MYLDKIESLWEASKASSRFCLWLIERGIKPAKWYAIESAELKSTFIGSSLILGCLTNWDKILIISGYSAIKAWLSTSGSISGLISATWSPSSSWNIFLMESTYWLLVSYL